MFAAVSSLAAEQNRVLANKNVIATSFYQLPALQAQILPLTEIVSLSSEVWQVLPNGQATLTEGKNWLQVKVVNLTDSTQNYFLLADDALHLLGGQLYIENNNHQLEQLNIKKHVNNALSGQFLLKSRQQLSLFLRINSQGQVQMPLSVLDNSQLISYQSKRFLTSGIAIGSIAMLTVILLVVFIANGSVTSLLLCGYFLMQTLLLSIFYGFNSYSIFPELVELQGIELSLLTSLSAMLILWFSCELFKFKYSHHGIYILFKVASWLMLIYLPISMFLSLDVNIILSGLINVIANIFLITLGVLLIKSGQRLALLFAAIFTIQLTFFLANIIFYGWQQFNAPLFTAAFWLNSLLISFLLSRDYTYQIEEKRTAQQEALENEMISRNTQEELLALQSENQEQLEIRVQERTLELNIALQELEEANRELEQKNTLDELTGLYNRRFYDQKIAAEFRRSRRNLTPLSLVIIDIDHFKSVNDNYGHLVGDKCLILLAAKIKQCLGRSTDVGCRYGGEEFCLILPETDRNGAIALAEELRKSVAAEEFFIGEQALQITISCGISTYQQEKQAAPEHLFSAADKALYQAKHQGRNRAKIQSIDLAIADQKAN